MKSTHVVMIGPAPEARGGIAAVVNVYRDAGLFKRWNVSYIATYDDTGALSKVRAATIALLRYIILLARGRANLIHVHSASRWSFVRKSVFILPALLLRKPVVFQLHGGEFISVYSRLGVLAKRYIRFVLEHCACVVVLSSRWKEMLQQIAPSATIRVIMNPIAAAKQDTSSCIRKRNTLLFLGRLEAQKGLYVLLDAVSRIGVELEPRLFLGGEGDTESVLHSMSEFGIANRVEILGWVDGSRKAELLQTVMVFVLPSFAEGLPMSMLEAMSHGTPVISTSVGGIPDVVEDGVDGILVPPGDPGKLANAIESLLKNPTVARQMGEAAHRKFEKNFSAAVIIPQVEALYSDLRMRPCVEASGGS